MKRPKIESATDKVMKLFQQWLEVNYADIPENLSIREHDLMIKAFVGGCLLTSMSQQDQDMIKRAAEQLKDRVVQ